ncbi:MAG: hypothetical protein UU37_C0007G0014 [Candidatus Gottesmanbacteria bacterium GW2011_GWA2_41_12]|uniref:Glycosyltransferase RgtA/B/C/D-like domain-containing protein n=1 Tax=Candidatus Gottesmanbacteria bacterium GW2011_GWA2_41_12 TaxID=1618440 RepID=A0A0G0XKU3_9BACT|nr:MAG: hypothetical protein UU37_C0007G0014 [Candidatus Gottesmanbacteria bacterium GW2011_GWA2_41_12]
MLSITVLPLVYFRLDEGLKRLYNADEVFHLHYGYLLSVGELPYRDFYMHFTPFFHYTLVPFFRIMGENLAIYTVARFYAFILFLFTMLVTYKLGKLLFGKEVGLLSVLTLLVIPLSIEKQIELRPDNLMIPVFVLGTYFFVQGLTLPRVRPSDYFKAFFLSGLFLGISFWLLLKIVPGLAGLGISYLIISFWRKINRREIIDEIKIILAGFLIPSVPVLLYLLLTNNLTMGLKSIFLYAYLVQQNLWFPQNIIFYFRPNDVIYGTYKGLPWFLNNFLFLIMFLGIALFTVLAFSQKNIKGKIKYSILPLPLILLFLYTFFIRTGFQQYFLPVFPFMAIIVAKIFWEPYNLLLKKLKFLALLYLVSLLFIFAKSGYDAWINKALWTNDEIIKIAGEELRRTNADDRIFDFKGLYIFRRDGYYNCCNNFLEYIPALRDMLPSFIEDMEKNKTKLIVFTPGSPFDRFSQKEADYIKTHFSPTDDPMIWERIK